MLPPAYALEPRLQASLLTCRPGSEIYELFGHEALRIRGIDEKGNAVDSVWNYGVFDFESPGFVPRFVKGETDYMVFPCPTELFLASYAQRGSGIKEQDLNLTPEETLRLRRLLQINSLPENRTYRYKYVSDNCSTRIVDMVDSAANKRQILYPDTVIYSSYRNAMRDFHRNYPWYQFGIDLVLGSGIDVPISSRQELFAPLLLEQKAAKARFSDGEPLISSSRVLIPGNEAGQKYEDGTYAFSLPATPWWATPLSVSSLVLVISLIISIWEWKKKRLAKVYNSLFFGILGLAGCLVWFLVFISTHEATSPNLLSLWLNPLQLAVALCLWWRHSRPIAIAMAIVNIVVVMMLAFAWPFQPQSTNPAVFLLWGATLALSTSLALVGAQQRKTEKRNHIDLSQFGHLPTKKKKPTRRNSKARKTNK